MTGKTSSSTAEESRADTPAAPHDAERCNDLLEALPAAIYTTDAAGRIVYWNKAAEALWGRRPTRQDEAWCGSWKLFTPDGEPLAHADCPMAQALLRKRPVRGVEALVERPDGTRVPFLPFPTPLHDRAGTMVGAVNMLVDISDRKRVEQSLARSIEEQRALYHLTDRLHRALCLEDIYDAALEAICRALRCQRASVLLFDAAGVMRFVAWRGLSDGYRQATDGHSPWQRDTTDPQPIAIDDVAVASFPERLQSTVEREGIGAMAFVPLVTDSRLVGKFMAYYDAPHRFTESEVELATTIARQLGFGVERLRAEEARRRAERQRDLLIAELNHRVKNTLATVISIAGQSFGKGCNVDESRRSFSARLRALAQTHGRLADTDWSGVSLLALMEDEVAPYRREDGSNIRLRGPAVTLNPRCTLTLGMTLHELATNAAKHGALSAKDGAIDVSWELVTTGQPTLRILWAETGGPEVRTPAHSGFGRLLLDRAVAADLNGEVELDFAPEGLRCTIAVPLSDNAFVGT